MKRTTSLPWVIELLAFFITLSPCHLVPLSSAAEVDADLSILKAAGIPTDGPGLSAYFKKHTSSASNEAQIKDLVRQLGDDDFKKREAASRQLVMFGPRAKLFLQTALKDTDPEIVRRAHDCLERIAREASVAALSASVRVLARRATDRRDADPTEKFNPAAVLLNYLPSAEDERVAETIHQVLPGLAVHDGKAEPALVEALTDESAVKRAAAAAALAGTHLPDVMPRVRKLLRDRDPHVRIRVGLALAAHGDKDALPVLIGTIDDVPMPRNGLVLELLDRLAAGASPPGMPIDDQRARHKIRQTWEAWWKDHQDKIDPDRLKEVSRSLGFTLIVITNNNTIEFLDRAKEARWKISDAQMPLDAQLLPGEQSVLIAEHKANRVSERNHKGEIVWKKMVAEPLMAQRLANGNTFIATRSELLEVDKDGKETFRYSRPDGSVFMRAAKLRDGDIACIVQFDRARYVRLTPAGKDFKESKSWVVQVRTSGGRVEVRPNGHVLIPEMDNNRVVEYDANGHIVWEAAIDQPIAAVRLPNGNTLITLMRENRAVEVDRAGKEVWQFKAETRVNRAFRR